MVEKAEILLVDDHALILEGEYVIFLNGFLKLW